MMLSLYVPVSSLYQEQLIATMSDGSHTLRSGNPKFKITKVLRPALDEILAKQIRVKGINTVVPMLRTLCERHEKFGASLPGTPWAGARRAGMCRGRPGGYAFGKVPQGGPGRVLALALGGPFYIEPENLDPPARALAEVLKPLDDADGARTSYTSACNVSRLMSRLRSQW